MNVIQIHAGAGSRAAPGRESPMVYEEVGLEPMLGLVSAEETAVSSVLDEEPRPSMSYEDNLDERMRKIIRALDR
jgi:hypothetical protein